MDVTLAGSPNRAIYPSVLRFVCDPESRITLHSITKPLGVTLNNAVPNRI